MKQKKVAGSLMDKAYVGPSSQIAECRFAELLHNLLETAAALCEVQNTKLSTLHPH